MIGLEAGKIKLCHFENEWSSLYEKEEEGLRKIIGDLIVDIFHIGSTSVRGCSAKPIIDILVSIKSYNDGCIIKERLGEEYEYKGECGIPGRHFIKKNEGKFTLYHIHIFETGSEEIEKHLLFRDYLRKHAQYIDEYCHLKQKLMMQFPDDRIAYTDGKTAFINKIIEKAKVEIIHE